MATDIAKAFFVGRLTKDIEVLFSNNGNLFGVINLAVNLYQGKNQPEKANFFRVTVPGRIVDAIGTYLTKGRQIAVDAVPVMNSWTDADGNRKTRVQFDASNIQLLSEPRHHGEEAGTEHTERRRESVNTSPGEDFEDGAAENGFEDDMPF